MSRPSSMAQRPLTLTEELEKLEQSITLTLQEIDHNFSQAHRIVTTSILPLIEQYSESSRDVWEGAKFWKQFFEASANVSLSGYEEKPEDTTTALQEDSDQSLTAHEQDTQLTAQQDESHLSLDDHREHEPELELTALSLSSHSTPRPYASHHHHRGNQQANDTTVPSSIAHPSPSPYDLHPDSLPDDSDTRDLARAAELADAENEDSFLPTTPGKYSASASASRTYRPTQQQQQQPQHQYPYHHDESHTPLSSSPFIPPAPTTTHEAYENNNDDDEYHEDPILHRFHDKTYRVQATPLSKKRQPLKHYLSTSKSIKFTNPMFNSSTTPQKPPAKKSKYSFDSSPISSPEPEAPQLHAEIFDSPLKGGTGAAQTPNTSRSKRRPSAHHPYYPRVTPKPGMSVLTPMKGGTGRPGGAEGWNSDDDLGVGGRYGGGYGGGAAFSDEDEDLGPSPPKTMQFHIPQSRLMKTPAKEASRRIVEDLLFTAGANDTTEDIVEEQSPSVIRRVEKLEDETF
ncbi:hypothetical protein BO86DRAFT_421722 [Aspergillus japonicus CBS 114.51]|uniref:DASH complex subunit ASK1 n=2 Tax=Aspergillus TaxID=5052 RepID=A0A2V5HHZ5_ASPV1|nr:hypothetical protein BO86DRAFT_421722 [Aspergillus japonicus CBS 114.51]PYI21504.1 hypothetical protein BO99DRAFT_472006 [Aspergillus violaceofuscus CBS 115571]RAH78257.1 hypothetical protein BO86DRAFT_421722 [Aspergillus japonicus CBS 114.51]